ncbi:hypothetical protein PTKIN_Ptkin11bG0072900 [Pterospermum kingtungense]
MAFTSWSLEVAQTLQQMIAQIDEWLEESRARSKIIDKPEPKIDLQLKIKDTQARTEDTQSKFKSKDIQIEVESMVNIEVSMDEGTRVAVRNGPQSDDNSIIDEDPEAVALIDGLTNILKVLKSLHDFFNEMEFCKSINFNVIVSSNIVILATGLNSERNEKIKDPLLFNIISLFHDIETIVMTFFIVRNITLTANESVFSIYHDNHLSVLIYKIFKELFVDLDILGIKHANVDGIEQLVLVIRGKITLASDKLELVTFGYCKPIEEIMFGDDKLTIFVRLVTLSFDKNFGKKLFEELGRAFASVFGYNKIQCYILVGSNDSLKNNGDMNGIHILTFIYSEGELLHFIHERFTKEGRIFLVTIFAPTMDVRDSKAMETSYLDLLRPFIVSATIKKLVALLFVDNILDFVQANSKVLALLGHIPFTMSYQAQLVTDLEGLNIHITTIQRSYIASVQAIYACDVVLKDTDTTTNFVYLDVQTI